MYADETVISVSVKILDSIAGYLTYDMSCMYLWK